MALPVASLNQPRAALSQMEAAEWTVSVVRPQLNRDHGAGRHRDSDSSESRKIQRLCPWRVRASRNRSRPTSRAVTNSMANTDRSVREDVLRTQDVESCPGGDVGERALNKSPNALRLAAFSQPLKKCMQIGNIADGVGDLRFTEVAL